MAYDSSHGSFVEELWIKPRFGHVRGQRFHVIGGTVLASPIAITSNFQGLGRLDSGCCKNEAKSRDFCITRLDSIVYSHSLSSRSFIA